MCSNIGGVAEEGSEGNRYDSATRGVYFGTIIFFVGSNFFISFLSIKQEAFIEKNQAA